jgi:hypothetical protein
MSNNIIVIEKGGVFSFEVNGKKLDVTININDNTPRLTIDGKDIVVPYVVGEPFKVIREDYNFCVQQPSGDVILANPIYTTLNINVDFNQPARLGVSNFRLTPIPYRAKFEYRTG